MVHSPAPALLFIIPQQRRTRRRRDGLEGGAATTLLHLPHTPCCTHTCLEGGWRGEGEGGGWAPTSSFH